MIERIERRRQQQWRQQSGSLVSRPSVMHRVGGHPYHTIVYTTTNHTIPTNILSYYLSCIELEVLLTILYHSIHHNKPQKCTKKDHAKLFSMTQDRGVILTNIQYNRHSVQPTFSTTNIQYDKHSVLQIFSMTQDRGVILTNILGPDSHLYQTPLLEKSSPISRLKWWRSEERKHMIYAYS